ncbi:DNA-3-methyladenine glycosylase 2 family protein [Nocardia speluncae]|uniref:DNA-3-methyladenine glycosylase II n=1 Tax=Nocardia speluncae TaxID=419477 RepID=A0A846XG83_9NOCA|nr:Ada metal-binding domain-containing protein [Nocardia speluncae]NKY34219.1 DNA-3-methyladenine glycosylase 2 family protein [Nocardia speluncae]
MNRVSITVLDFERCYRAVTARDSRFDGQFYTAVRTTGIYCRPSCPAITPKPANVTFLPTAAAAQQAGYRACRRCLPDAAPGSPLWNTRADLAARAMRLIGDGVVERGGVSALAATLGYSQRQLTRVLTSELGAGPLALARAHRAHTARLLIQTTEMPISDIAFAAGFASIRQFNDTVREVFAVSPSTMRAEAQRRSRTDSPRQGRAESARRGRSGSEWQSRADGQWANEPGAPTTCGTLTLRLPYREPLDRDWLEWFLSAHTTPGLELWQTGPAGEGTYLRNLRTPHGYAGIRLSVLPGHVRAELALRDMRDLAPTVARIRHLLDLDADPVAIDEALLHAGQLPGAGATFTSGIRVPGCADPSELLLRTMIGQQISVAAANTHTARLVAALGEPTDGPIPRLFPTAAAIAENGAEVLAGPAQRIRSITAAAAALASGELVLHQGRTAADLRRDLLALPGIGPWTADYVTMRLLADPDILLTTDLVVRRGAARHGIDLSDSTRWSPWRSYLSMQLWRSELRARAASAKTADSEAKVSTS